MGCDANSADFGWASESDQWNFVCEEAQEFRFSKSRPSGQFFTCKCICGCTRMGLHTHTHTHIYSEDVEFEGILLQGSTRGWWIWPQVFQFNYIKCVIRYLFKDQDVKSTHGCVCMC